MIGIYSIFATYFYFLLFAQFSFLEQVKSAVGLDKLQVVMAAMGGAGLMFSLLAIWLLRKFSASKLISISFLLCAFTSFVSLYASSITPLCIIAFLIGAALAVLTVSLASIIGSCFNKLGLYVGVGTGLAYFTCNIPQVFNASVNNQALFVSLACLLGAAFHFLYNDNDYTHPQLSNSKWQILVSFIALVWFDCAAFYVIQHAGELRSATWHGDYRLWSNSLIHFLSAVFAGVLIDKQHIKIVLVFAFLFLAVGVLSLNEYSFYSAPFYCAGVSFYSTALVAFPTLTADRKVYFAGLTYALAGWFGSAMGIGMAQDLKTVPLAFIVISGIVVISSLYFSGFSRKRRTT